MNIHVVLLIGNGQSNILVHCIQGIEHKNTYDDNIFLHVKLSDV